MVMGTEQINIILHNTIYVPAHFHATVAVGTTLAFMALLRIKRDHDDQAVAALQKYKALDKMIGTYILSWQDKMYNGRLHGSYHQTGARTTRLSSSDPNLQNIPAHGIYGPRLRSLIGAPPGYALLVADYSQIEMRLLAHYSKDPILMDVYDKSLDIHQETADRLDIERYQAKSVNFGWIYGMQWRGLQDNIEQQGRPRPEAKQAKAWLNYYEQVYSGATRWRNRVIAYAKQLGYVTTIWGKKRRLPNITMYDKKLRAQAERQAVNSVIQGTAANIIEDAMLTLGLKAKDFGGKMVCQVHDELVFEMPINVTEEFAAIAKRDMEAVRETYNLRVPIISEYDIGPDWGSAKH